MNSVSHRPAEESIAAFKSCRNPNGIQVAEVTLLNWLPGASAVSAIKAVRNRSALRLVDVKHDIHGDDNTSP